MTGTLPNGATGIKYTTKYGFVGGMHSVSP